MKLLALQIDGYGIWSGLRVERFAEGLNVLYGPNEAGKTTLLQFIRSMLYGFADSRRQYLPPVFGGRPGGMAEVDGPQGHYEIARHWLPDSGGDEIVLTAADGTRQGEHLAKAMLADVDETTFNNVFAVELREMQELGALGDTAAAELLYNLTAGLDRVSLVEVIRELENSRNRILDAAGNPCIIANLRSQREKLCAEIDELGGLTRRFALLLGERTQLERELAKLEEERNQLDRQSRLLELAASLRDRWTRRAAIDEQLAAIGPTAPLAEKMIARLDALNAKLQRHRQRIAQLRHERSQLRGEAAGIAPNEDLLRQFARIEALQEQESWFLGIRNQINDLQAEIDRLENESAGQWKQVGLVGATMSVVGKISPRTFAALRSPAKNLRRARQNIEQLRSETTAAQESAGSLAKEVAAALAARNESSLTEAMEKAGATVSQCRRRLQIDDRLDQLARHRDELEEDNHRAAERQVLPTWTLAALGAFFILGVLLVATGLLVLPILYGSANWVTFGAGLACVVGTIIGKRTLERTNAGRLDATQRQLALVEGQLRQLEEERDDLDGRLPRGGGPLAVRLDTAEKDLAALESLVPLESRRTSAEQTASAANERAAQAEEEFKAARRKWRESLAAVGLPVELTAQQVRQLAGRWTGLSENAARLMRCREELDRRRKEAETLAARIAQVAADAKVTLPAADPVEQLKHLSAALAEEQSAAARRETVRGQLKKLCLMRARHEEAIGRLNHRRRSLFFEAGAEDEDSFREKAAASARADVLCQERASLDGDIAAAVGKQCSEDAIGELLGRTPPAELESRANLLRDRLALLTAQVAERLEKRGQLSAQIQALADDRRLPRLQLELAAVDRQIDDAMRRWQVLAVLSRLLTDIRASYERDRQPETLKEASEYLARLTRGRYVRVWTPFGERTLRVDDVEGNSLPVESLSRGTREQLFLSLRLALTASYARRGSVLPMVLDDVLVNFDVERAVAAAEVLRDFAAAGHQLLVCTCHEHIEKIFASLGAPMNRLPGASHAGGAVISFARAAIVEEPKPERPRPPARRKPAKAKVIVEDDAPLEEEPLELPPPRPARLPPAKKPRLPAKKAAKSSGVFDVDFFDNETQASANGDEFEELDDDSSVWQDDAAGDADEENHENEDDGFDDELADDEEKLN